MLLIYRVLQHFSTSPKEYSIIFTSGCTGALKLVAEVFDYHGNCQCCLGESGLPQGSFTYLLDNHTSAEGMREYAFHKAATVQCIDYNTKQETFEVISRLKGSDLQRSCGNHLFVCPAQSNFSGKKYPLKWINAVKNGQMPWQKIFHQSDLKHDHVSGLENKDDLALDECEGQQRSHDCHGDWYTVLDAASLVSTSPLDLSTCKPDFVTISFYKMFGFPTGLGGYQELILKVYRHVFILILLYHSLSISLKHQNIEKIHSLYTTMVFYFMPLILEKTFLAHLSTKCSG